MSGAEGEGVSPKGLRGFPTQYAMAVANGVATFAGLQALSTFLPSAADFSQVSTAVMLFTQYLIFVDLGTHAHFLEHAASRGAALGESDWKMLLKARIALALLALPLSAAHTLVGNFSAELTAAVLVLQTGLLWVAYTSSLDTWRMATGKPAQAIALRISRIVGLLAIVAWVWLRPQTTVWAAALALQLGLAACTLAFIVRNWRARAQSIRASNEAAARFLKTSLPFGLLTLGLVGQQLLLQAVLVRDVGETRLAGWNAAIALATPFVLGFQTLTQVALPRLLASVRADRRERLRALLHFSLLQGTIGTAAAAVVFSAAQMQLLELLFRGTGTDLGLLTGLLLANQFLLNILWPLMLLVHRNGAFKTAMWSIVLAGIAWVPLQSQMTNRFGPPGAAMALLLLACTQVMLGLFLYLRRGPAQMDEADDQGESLR